MNLDGRREKTLHICFGSECNNNCIFCMEERFIEYNKKTTLDEHINSIKNSLKEKFTRIVFTSKEPTLSYKELIPIIEYSKKVGYEDIMLVTNGRLLKYRKLVEKLINSGLNHIEISLHGSNRKIHELLTRTPGSFDDAVQGIENIKSLSKANKINYTINFTVTFFNYKDIIDFYNFAMSFNPKKIIFNCFMPTHSSASHMLIPKYSDIRMSFEKIKGKKFTLIDFPICVFSDSFSKNLGNIEDYHISDDFGENYITDPWKSSKAKLESCAVCIYKECCQKPSKEYIKKYGASEFKSITSK